MSELNKFPTQINANQFVKFIDKSQIDSIVQSLAKSISQKYKGESLILIAPLKGSSIFLSDLIRHIKDVQIVIDFIAIDSIERSKETIGTIQIKKDISVNIQDKNVLIVEEIIDTARALDFLCKRLELSNPRSLEILTLFDKPHKRYVKLEANYIGKQLDDQFVIGYGLDLESYGRNLKDLYYLEFPN
ncbi:MAG: hypoxanthine phosphoribosyltransferase [Bacteriovoracaceae bacterium]|jgi:hypoxanthine phosphoribosyltransferase|nr:hypoxanthine phosphoribosyltransferase [Bacteriovoracaceae bacterium]